MVDGVGFVPELCLSYMIVYFKMLFVFFCYRSILEKRKFMAKAFDG
jgi:hypothetical protein